MKTKSDIPLFVLVVSILFCAIPPAGNPPANAADLVLSNECWSNRLTLRWTGAQNIKLQQTTNLANSTWQDVSGSAGVNTWQISMTNAVAFFRLANPVTPDDADGLDAWFEIQGWDIFIDAHGYGTDGLVIRHVTSDPTLADTDGDGISDFWEWLLGTDPRLADTDGDGLSDYEEWFRWQTSPTSVDTDGDARGPNHNLQPKAQLFDGNELTLLHTSPTLEDTDGDGRTDYEEFDQPGRNPLVAQLPNLAVEFVDAVDVRLDVQYAEEAGSSRQYGGELTQSTSTNEMHSSAQSVNASLKVGYGTTIGLNASAMWTADLTVGWAGTWTSQTSTSQGMEQSYSDYTTDSRTRTESAASGSMSGGIRLRNTGPVTYTLTDFGFTVRYLMPGGDFKTLATLIPTLGANGITLAPGDTTPVLQVQATGLNASRVKEFIARPNSLQLEPAFYEMENAEGLNFDFLEEITRWRTARVQIDFGDGRNEEYRIASNVERNNDGSYAGVTMGNVMSNILKIPFQTMSRQTLQTNCPTNERVLYSVRDLATTSPTNGFWAVFLSAAATPQAGTNFENIVLQAGDAILLTFIRDDDGDGLFAPEEQHFGTTEASTPETPAPSDSDGDGLTDVFEARTGWDVIVLNRTNHVYSDPRQVDQDRDGLTDLHEFQIGTDPTNPDTDADGLSDATDPHPLVPAKVLRVKWDAVPGGTNGASWATAFTNLQDAFAVARAGQATTNSDDDVAEIWVAAGVYKPTTTTNDRNASFSLVNNTAVYGGFAGVETKLSQRESDPLFNGTVLSGDLLDNDASTYNENPVSFGDNSLTVCSAGGGVGSGAVLDGFTITGGNNDVFGGFGGGMLSYGNPRLRNLLFRANNAFAGGGLAMPVPADTAAAVSDCLYLQNSALFGGGMVFYGQSGSNAWLALTNCQFILNDAASTGVASQGGALYIAGSIFMEGCSLSMNRATNGGGIYFGGDTTMRISNSRFDQNTATDHGGGLSFDIHRNLLLEVVQSVFWKNSATYGGGAISIITNNSGYADKTASLYVINSSFCTNSSASGGGILVQNNLATTRIENSILWACAPNDINIANYQSRCRVRTSCLPSASSYPAAGNINADPKFVNAAAGDLRLGTGSPCIDAGNNYVDYFPTVPGFQLLPATDIDGFWRVVDGNGDGTPTVDMGAHERQGT